MNSRDLSPPLTSRCYPSALNQATAQNRTYYQLSYPVSDTGAVPRQRIPNSHVMIHRGKPRLLQFPPQAIETIRRKYYTHTKKNKTRHHLDIPDARRPARIRRRPTPEGWRPTRVLRGGSKAVRDQIQIRVKRRRRLLGGTAPGNRERLVCQGWISREVLGRRVSLGIKHLCGLDSLRYGLNRHGWPGGREGASRDESELHLLLHPFGDGLLDKPRMSGG